jgi:Type I restriction modification DNA specificity domain
VNKESLSESDICEKYTRPAMERAGWNGMNQIYREYPLRAGRVVVRGRRLLPASSYGAKPGLNLKNIKDLPVPVPPLAEQLRILARVTELRRLCADLRQRLDVSQTKQSDLADALLERAATA